MKKESYCKKCNRTKEINEFYNSNLSTCKGCKKQISKNNTKNNKYAKDINENIYEINKKMDLLEIKINSLELLFKEVIKKINRGNVICS